MNEEHGKAGWANTREEPPEREREGEREGEREHSGSRSSRQMNPGVGGPEWQTRQTDKQDLQMREGEECQRGKERERERRCQETKLVARGEESRGCKKQRMQREKKVKRERVRVRETMGNGRKEDGKTARNCRKAKRRRGKGEAGKGEHSLLSTVVSYPDSALALVSIFF